MISILISIYYKEDPISLDVSLRSLVNQTIAPKDIVIIRDGDLPPCLDLIIQKYSLQLPIRVFSTHQNLGLSKALNFGIKKISNPWIMRFDSDDVCLPNRIELQQKLILSNRFDIIGSQIEEFLSDPNKTIRTRGVPLTHNQIIEFSKFRNPFNHMTICFRRELAERVGCYPTIPFMEDYALWLLMIQGGARCINMPNALVKARVGNGMVSRRGGIKYISSEIRLQKLMYDIKYKTAIECMISGIARSAVFIMPTVIRSFIYHAILRNKH